MLFDDLPWRLGTRTASVYLDSRRQSPKIACELAFSKSLNRREKILEIIAPTDGCELNAFNTLVNQFGLIERYYISSL